MAVTPHFTIHRDGSVTQHVALVPGARVEPDKEYYVTYNSAAARLVVAEGQPVRENDSFYGWVDYEYYWHVKGRDGYGRNKYSDGPCEIVLGSDITVYTEEVSEFAGTDASADTYQVLEMRGLTCACGARKDVTWRYKGTMSDVLTSLIKDEQVPQFIPKDEVDTTVQLAVQAATQDLNTRLCVLQDAITTLADTYFNKAQDPSIAEIHKKVLESVHGDLTYAVKMSDRKA